MATSFYELQLVCLVLVCAVFLLVDRQLSKRRRHSDVKAQHDHHLNIGAGPGAAAAAGTILSKLTRQYLTVYAIVMGECNHSMRGTALYSES